MVSLFDLSYLRFFVVSIGFHFVLFSFIYWVPPLRVSKLESIPVSILEPTGKEQPAPIQVPRTPRTRSANIPTFMAKKSLVAPERSDGVGDRKKTENNRLGSDSTPPPARSSPSETVPEHNIIAERRLPTVRELLPPLNWSSNSRNSGPVSLNSSDPLNLTYLDKIKQLIHQRWEYPELAKRYGFQGKLILEFTITAGGEVEQLRLVRTSGYHILDDAALMAVKAAAPFPPIPNWVKPNPLPISATMEY